VAQRVAQGFRFISVGLDTKMLLDAAREMATRCQAEVAP